MGTVVEFRIWITCYTLFDDEMHDMPACLPALLEDQYLTIAVAECRLFEMICSLINFTWWTHVFTSPGYFMRACMNANKVCELLCMCVGEEKKRTQHKRSGFRVSNCSEMANIFIVANLCCQINSWNNSIINLPLKSVRILNNNWTMHWRLTATCASA